MLRAVAAEVGVAVLTVKVLGTLAWVVGVVLAETEATFVVAAAATVAREELVLIDA